MADSYGFHPHQSTETFEAAVKRSIAALKKIEAEFDTIVATGASGTTVASVVAYLMGKQLVIVRKPGENSHCYDPLSGDIKALARTVWLDDFVSGGATYERIVKLVGRPRWALLYYLGSHFQCVSSTHLGLVAVERYALHDSTPNFLYMDRVTEDTDERFLP